MAAETPGRGGRSHDDAARTAQPDPTAHTVGTQDHDHELSTVRTPVEELRGFGKREVAVGIGNFMEWFDFAVYGYFAAAIAHEFFPSDDPTSSFLSTFAVFAVGFFARPIGAAILGPLGDKYGRRAVLMISVLAMGITTMLIGLVPNFATIGIAAPILITVLRFCQGLSVGGEWSSSAMFLVESAPERARATRGSIISMTAGLAFLVGTGVALLINSVLSQEQVFSWGWRIPFVSSFVMGLIAVYIRRNLEDTPVFTRLTEKRERKEEVHVDRAEYMRGFILTLAFAGIFGVSLYYLVTYMNNYLQQAVGVPTITALVLCLIGLFVYVLLNPLSGLVSDRIGRRPMALGASIGFAVLGIPLFWMLSTGNSALILIALLIWAVLQSMIAVMGVVLLVEVFPAPVRSTGSALGYNIAYALLAGPGPFIATWLVSQWGPVAPGFYLVAVAIVSTIILWKMLPETLHKDIHA